MSDIVVFGIQDTASLAHFYLDNDTEHNVVAFTVHERFMPPSKQFEGKPVIPFEDLAIAYPPGQYKAFCPMVHAGMGKLRMRVYHEFKDRGYELISYISSMATVFSDVGENCFILEDNTIQPFVKIGNNIVMWSGNHIGHHGTIEDHVFFTSHVVLSGHCQVGERSFFGVNSTIRNNLTIGKGTLVAMGACVTKDTCPWTVVAGVPAKPRGDSREAKV